MTPLRLGTPQRLQHVVVFGVWAAAPPLALLLLDALGRRGAGLVPPITGAEPAAARASRRFDRSS